MTASALEAAPSAAAAPPRPRRWTSSARREREAAEPPIKAGPEQTARRFARGLAERYCRWPGAYCLWPSDDHLAEVLELTEHQLRYRLRLADRHGLIRRFSSLAAFGRWLETEGAPNHGLDPDGPRNLTWATRVIVIVDRLPPAAPDHVYGPLRLPVDDTPVQGQNSTPEGANPPSAPGRICPPEGGDFAPAHPIGSSNLNPEGETYVGHVSTPVDHKTRTKTPTADELWEAMSSEERAERLEVEALRSPALGRWPNMLRAIAVERLAAEAGVPVAPEASATRSGPEPAPISQGCPRRGASARRGPLPALPSSPPPPPARRRPAPARRACEDTERGLADLVAWVESPDPDSDPAIGAEILADLLAYALDDPGSEPWYRDRCLECLRGDLSVDCLVDAVRAACAPAVRDRGALANWYVSRYRETYRDPGVFETPTAGTLAKVPPAVGSRPVAHRSQTQGRIS